VHNHLLFAIDYYKEIRSIDMAKGLKSGIALLLCGIMLLTGCGLRDTEDEREAVDFTVVSEDRLPSELAELLESKKVDGFRLTYTDGAYLYVCIGYGEQATGGYSISVKEFSEADNILYVDTLLIGPETVEDAEATPSYPMIVLKMENREVQVNFL